MKSKRARDALTYRVTAVLDPLLDDVTCALALRRATFWSDLTCRTVAQVRHVLTFNVQPVLLPATQLAAALWYRRVLFLYCLSYKLMEQPAEPAWVKRVVPRVWSPSYSVYFTWQLSVATSCRHHTTPTVIRAAEQLGCGGGVGELHSNVSCIFIFFIINLKPEFL